MPICTGLESKVAPLRDYCVWRRGSEEVPRRNHFFRFGIGGGALLHWTRENQVLVARTARDASNNNRQALPIEAVRVDTVMK